MADDLVKYAKDIEAARAGVARAYQAHSKGTGTIEQWNKANRALADAHDRFREVSGNRVPDTR